MWYNRKTHQILIWLGIIVFLWAILYYKIVEFTPVKNIQEISKQEQQEYDLAIDIIQSFSGKFQQENYPTIDNYLSVALITHPEFQEKYGSSVKIFGRIPFYWSDTQIRAYEYILVSGGIVSGSIYEVWVPVNPLQISRNLFFVPHFSVALALAKATGTIHWNKYIHDGICVENSTKIYCLPEEKPSIKGIHELIERIDTGNNQFYGLESKMKEYFWTWWFYSFWERGYVYFDPRTNRVFAPMPWSIMTYDDLR